MGTTTMGFPCQPFSKQLLVTLDMLFCLRASNHLFDPAPVSHFGMCVFSPWEPRDSASTTASRQHDGVGCASDQIFTCTDDGPVGEAGGGSFCFPQFGAALDFTRPSNSSMLAPSLLIGGIGQYQKKKTSGFATMKLRST